MHCRNLLTHTISEISLVATVEEAFHAGQSEQLQPVNVGSLLSALRFLENSRCQAGPPAEIVSILLKDLRGKAMQALS
jgi:hypothetical protein